MERAIVVPHRFYTQPQGTGDRHVYASQTRFIPDLLTDNFDVTSWPLTETEIGTPRKIMDLAAHMRGAWN